MERGDEGGVWSLGSKVGPSHDIANTNINNCKLNGKTGWSEGNHRLRNIDCKMQEVRVKG